MLDDKFLDDLFEAARNEPAVRSMESVEQFVQAAGSGTSTSLIVQWLKQHKMNILISASSVMIATSVLLFSEPKVSEVTTLVEAKETTVELATTPEVEPELQVENTSQPNPDREVVLKQDKNKEEAEVKEMNVEEEATKDNEEDRPVVASRVQAQQRTANPSPVAKPISVDNAQSNDPKQSVFTEHTIVLESSRGKASASEFESYLTDNLSQLRHQFTSKASSNQIKKFTLELDNRIKARFKMQVSGFEKLELHWESNSDGDIKDVWYRLDSTEKKELDFSKACKSSITVKHTHEEF